MKTLKPSTAAAPLKKPNPWGRPSQATPTVCSLAAVMDEELAKKLQKDEEEQSTRLVAGAHISLSMLFSNSNKWF